MCVCDVHVPLSRICRCVFYCSREALIIETCLCIQVAVAKCTLESFDYFADFYVRLFCMSDGRVPEESK